MTLLDKHKLRSVLKIQIIMVIDLLNKTTTATIIIIRKQNTIDFALSMLFLGAPSVLCGQN